MALPPTHPILRRKGAAGRVAFSFDGTVSLHALRVTLSFACTRGSRPSGCPPGFCAAAIWLGKWSTLCAPWHPAYLACWRHCLADGPQKLGGHHGRRPASSPVSLAGG